MDCPVGTMIQLKAPAKINLILRVTGRRADGYHELATWMQKLSLFDLLNIEIMDQPGIRLTCSGGGVPEGEDNLVWRAARLFFSRSQRALGKGVSVHLEKRIPIAAGLGGGSSDAGTLLKGLNSLFDEEFDRQTLIDMAVGLGADVPLFVVDEKSVFATGIGEKMVAIPPLKGYTIVLVNPGRDLSTAEVFRNFALTNNSRKSILTGSCASNRAVYGIEDLCNDLEETAMSMLPVIAEIKVELRRAGADGVLMSGSGPTVFGLFRKEKGNRRRELEQILACMKRGFGDKVYAVDEI